MPQTIRVHKIRLIPTQAQEQHLRRACAAARYAYNYGKEWLDVEYDVNRGLYQMGIDCKSYFTHANGIKKYFNQIKDRGRVAATGTATQEAFADLQKSVQRYWDIQTGKITLPPPKINRDTGQPKRRKDGRSRGWLTWRNWRHNMAFRQTYQGLKVEGKTIAYAKAVGPIRMCEEFRFPFKHLDRDNPDKFISVTFSFDGLYWWASISARITVPEPIHPNPDEAVGVDLGITYLGTASDGQVFDNPKAYAKSKKRLAILQRQLDRMRRANNPDNYNGNGTAKRGCEWVESNRMKKLNLKISKLHQRVANIRLNASHKMTAALTNDYGIVCLEDLNINGMMRNRKLSKAIADAALFEKRRQFEYKAKQKGGITSLVSQWFASSKLCNLCGCKNGDLKLSERIWECPNCHSVNERDPNAAKNIRDEGLRGHEKSRHRRQVRRRCKKQSGCNRPLRWYAEPFNLHNRMWGWTD